jgi:hypothetical protein
MRKGLAVALAALAAAACGRGAPVAGPACPRDPSYDRVPAFEVVFGTVATSVRHDLGLADLARLPGTEALGPGGKLQGLTVAEHQLAYKSGVAVTSKLFGGPECAWIEKLTVDVTPRSMTIYVPSEYPEGSCEEEQILAHERQHEEIHRDTLAEYADVMRGALGKADWLPGRGAPLAVSGRDEADRRVDEMVDKITKPVYAEFKAELAKRQAVIDVPENYRWVSRRCDHWK